MSDYKRFLSYIYAYDGDYKMNGAGFAKMEVRDNRYRLTVNLNCTLTSQGKGYRVGVYGGSEESLSVVDIGGLEQKNGGYLFQITGNVQTFAGGRINIDGARGLVLYREAGSRIYITSWSDPFVQIRNLRECIYKSKNGTESAETIKVDALSENSKRPEIIIQYKKNEAVEEQNDFGKDAEIENNVVQSSSEALINNDDESGNVFIKNLVQLGRNVKSDEVHADNKESELKAAADLFRNDIEEINKEIRESKEIKETEELQLKTAEVGELWHEFKRMYPKIRPFSEEGWEVLQIKVQDIGRLSRENWILGNNNFVLHGYYRYGYLILARRHKPDMDLYVLGVPGTFSMNEKFMASMFGMPDFMEADKKKPDLPKNFGYWCTHITM